jgi:CHAT domain-containing protein
MEEALKRQAPSRILHLATHGFFLPNRKSERSERTPLGDSDPALAAARRLSRLRATEDPLLRSGLVLAGANAPDAEGIPEPGYEDGWVTAAEIALLNLRGTELVVLSACESGLGDVRSGEGVYGLRRAFQYAGARTLITSLIKVPDAPTRDLMRRFYSGLKAGKGKLEALHGAQLQLLRERRAKNGAAHPLFWASFVLVGDPR